MTEVDAKERLRRLIEQKALITNAQITLSTGSSSSFYFDCKRVVLDGEGLNLVADLMLEAIDGLAVQATAIGGLTMGADFIVSAVIMRAHERSHPTARGCIVRKESKQHGTQSVIENRLPAGTRIVVVDDVITSGSAIRKACQAFVEEGYELAGIVALIDRQAGGKESLEKDFGVPVLGLYSKDDFAALSA